jgi:diguanylate cyclase (GGDEF)-like protein
MTCTTMTDAKKDQIESPTMKEVLTLLERQKDDLEIALSTAIEHGDFVEEQLTEVNNQLVKEVEERKRAEESLQKLVKIINRQKEDLEIALSTAIEHGDAIEEQLFEVNRQLNTEIGERRQIENQLDAMVNRLSRQKEDLELLVETIASHGDEINEQMHAQLTSVQELARTDSLTGLWNRRSFDETFAIEWNRHLRSGDQLGVLVIDVDFFKAFNDHFGHQAGDQCLKSVGQILSDCPRRSGEMAARYGGEEFAVILPNCDKKAALRMAESARSKVESLGIAHPVSSFGHVTASVGVAVMIPGKSNHPDDLFEQADAALYHAKQNGRNQVFSK